MNKLEAFLILLTITIVICIIYWIFKALNEEYKNNKVKQHREEQNRRLGIK